MGLGSNEIQANYENVACLHNPPLALLRSVKLMRPKFTHCEYEKINIINLNVTKIKKKRKPREKNVDKKSAHREN